MRILQVGVAIEGGGAERVIVDLARGLRARRHEVMVAFLEGTDKVVPSLEAEGIACRRLLKRQQFAASPLADFTPSSILGFRRLIGEFRPDVISAHIPRPTLWVSLAQRLRRASPPLIYTEHTVPKACSGVWKRLYGCFLPVTDHVVCVSQAAHRGFVQHWQWPAERVTRIWNGIDVARVAPALSPPVVRQSLQTPADAPVVCNVANLNSLKAQEILVAAMGTVHAALPQARCWIAGSVELEPPTAALVRAEIASRKLERCVQILGPRRDVADLVNAADVFVLSSRQEGFPITILEAMAAGKPVVATDVGGCAEAVSHGETGLIVPPEDPWALAEALQYLLTHPEEARAMGEAGRRRVAEQFTIAAMVDRHLELYERVLANRAHGAGHTLPGRP